MFYRVRVIAKTGAIVSCEPWDCESGNERYTFVVEADDEEQARKKACELYLATQLVALRARRERHKVAGNCRCGRKPREGGKQCDVCLKASKDSKVRTRAKVAGEPLPPKPPKSVAFAARASEKQAETRLHVLERVHGAWCRAVSQRDFTTWLTAEIEDAKREVGKCQRKVI